MNPDGSNLTRLTNNTASYGDVLPAWSPDGNKIVFVTNRDGNNDMLEIYSMNADGTNQTRLTSNSYRDEHPSWFNPFP